MVGLFVCLVSTIVNVRIQSLGTTVQNLGLGFREYCCGCRLQDKIQALSLCGGEDSRTNVRCSYCKRALLVIIGFGSYVQYYN